MRYIDLLTIVISLCFCSNTLGADDSTFRKFSSYPMDLAGIQLGSSGEQLMNRYGKGLYIEDEGHTGGAYYVASDRSITLHVEFGVDYIIDSISISKGVTLPKGWDKAKNPLKTLEFRDLKTSALISLGRTPEEAIRRLGTPKEDKVTGSRRTLKFIYDYQDGSNLPCQLFYEAKFEFEKNDLAKLTIYCGE